MTGSGPENSNKKKKCKKCIYVVHPPSICSLLFLLWCAASGHEPRECAADGRAFAWCAASGRAPRECAADGRALAWCAASGRAPRECAAYGRAFAWCAASVVRSPRFRRVLSCFCRLSSLLICMRACMCVCVYVCMYVRVVCVAEKVKRASENRHAASQEKGFTDRFLPPRMYLP